MSRQEVTNTFTKGMIMDLNPINTPNEVLTDCVNGTLITYDGNEYTLQNEKGNYELKNCKLKKNYIPVGLKEYGDILYIVSYNPLNKHVEIGSYPSPKTIKETGEEEEIPLYSIESLIKSGNYSKLAEQEKLYVFYGGTPPENYKLNPGDKYKVSLDGWSNCQYETLEFYAIDDERKTYHLGSYHSTSTPPYLEGENSLIRVNEDGFKYIKWDVPGWLGVKPRLAFIDDFKVNVRKIVFSNYTSLGYLALNLQLTTSDKIFTNMENVCEDLYAELNITIADKDEKTTLNKDYKIELNNRVDLKNGSHTYYANFPLEDDQNDGGPHFHFKADDKSIITITVTPYLKIDEATKICFDEYIRTLTFDVSKKGNVDDFTIGADSWRYGTYNDEKKFTLTFDTRGLEATSVLNSDVFLFYNVYSLSRDTILENQPCTNWVMLGETSMEIDLKEYKEGSKEFVAEDIYVFEFKFYDSDTVDSTCLKEGIYKLVVASELMNKFVDEGVSNFEDITFDQWISGYEDSIKNKSIRIAEFTEGNFSEDLNVLQSDEYKIWSKDSEINKYSHFINQSVYKSRLKNGFTLSCGGKYTASVKYNSDIKLLFGPLWNKVLETSKINIKIGNTSIDGNIEKATGKNISLNNTNLTNIEGRFELRDTYQLKDNEVVSIYNINKIPLNTNTYTWTKKEDESFSFSSDITNIKEYLKCLGTWGHSSGNGNTITSSTVSSSTKVTVENTDFTNPAIKSLLNTVADNYDAIILKLQTATSDKAGGSIGCRVHIIVGDDNDAIYSLEGANSAKTGDDIFVIGIPIQYNGKNILAILKFDKDIQTNVKSCVQKFNEWAKNIIHIIADKEVSTGSFYEADKVMDNEVFQTILSNITASLTLGTFLYNDVGNNTINMWVGSDRLKLISDTFKNLNTTNLISVDGFTKNTFDNSSLSIESLPITLDISLLDNARVKLSEMSNEIDKINEEIREQYYNRLETKEYDIYTPGINIYRDLIDETKAPTDLMELLTEKRISGSSVPAKYRVHRLKSGGSVDYNYYFGMYDENLTL